jgi:hypothetical protein
LQNRPAGSDPEKNAGAVFTLLLNLVLEVAMLLYLSYDPINLQERPAWVQKLKDAMPPNWVLYDPWMGVAEQAQDPLFLAVLKKTKPVPNAQSYSLALQLDPRLFEVPDKILPTLVEIDVAPTVEHCFKDLYFLMRSRAVVADLDTGLSRDGAYKALYARLLDVPVVGIARRYILSPWLLQCCSVVLKPDDTPDSIVQQVSALKTPKKRKAAVPPPAQKKTKTKVRGRGRRKPR